MKLDTGKTISSRELAKIGLETQIERNKNPEKWRGLMYGIDFIDKITGGARRSEVIGIAGSQKAGKSIAGQAITKNFGYQLMGTDEIGLHVSLEMSFDQLFNRFVANTGEIDSNLLRDYNLGDNEENWEALHFGAERLDDLPVWWNDGCFSIEALEQLIEEYKTFEYEGEVKFLRFVCVDYFQLMTTSAPGKAMWEGLRKISKRLKQLAKKYQITILILSQQTRESLKSIKTQKSGNTLAGTQGLVQDLDLLFLLLPVEQDGKEVNHLRHMYISESRSSEAKVGCDIFFSGKYARIGSLSEEGLEKITIDDIPERIRMKPVQTTWENW